MVCITYCDIDHLGAEDLADPIADEIVDGLHVQLGRKALLDAVDHRQFGGALLGLLEEASGLIE